MIDILTKTMYEIQTYGFFESLEIKVNQTAQLRCDQIRMEQNYEMWTEVLQEIQFLIQNNKTNYTKEIDDLINQIQSINSVVNAMKYEHVTKIGTVI